MYMYMYLYMYNIYTIYTGLIFNGGNCRRCPRSLPWCPFKSPNRNLQIPHRGALCHGKIALPLQVQSIRPVYMPPFHYFVAMLLYVIPLFTLFIW